MKKLRFVTEIDPKLIPFPTSQVFPVKFYFGFRDEKVLAKS
ncbi:MAG: hypothetical protein Q8T03_10330 [Bacteroidota bacterium]|nr:hypothetical protein [Bacteroidota bacterium]